MTKTFFISLGLILIIVLLLIIAIKPPTTIVTTPQTQVALQPQVQEKPTARYTEEPRGQPSPKEETPPPAGVPAEVVYPKETIFWVNEIRAPDTEAYVGGVNFIPIKEDRLKTFAGSFGPYYEDPIPYVHVILCAEFYKVKAAPSCEIVPLIYRDNYVSFAKGYQFDEYIGGMAAKDYIAYFNVYYGDEIIGYSNRAVIRTIKD